MVSLEKISFIEDSHGKKAVILELESYNKIQEQLEELEDIKSYIQQKNSPDEKFPFSLVQNLIENKTSKIKVLRQYRNLNVTELAKMSKITESYLSQIENKKRKGTINLYKKLAKALDVDIEFIA
jgi:ribosome-binding protein aMBF1 (putative translation factor)|tara:strand:- start:105 stop:479 length:375 start_codon:yes stop_codon:yes gene_type:complete